MGKKTYVEALSETVAKDAGKLGENTRSKKGERERTMRDVKGWVMMLFKKYRYPFPPKAPPFQLIFLERREAGGGVLNSFLEKRVIDSDPFTMCVKEPKSRGNWRGKIYSDNIFVKTKCNILRVRCFTEQTLHSWSQHITCSVFNRTDPTQQTCSVRFNI